MSNNESGFWPAGGDRLVFGLPLPIDSPGEHRAWDQMRLSVTGFFGRRDGAESPPTWLCQAARRWPTRWRASRCRSSPPGGEALHLGALATVSLTETVSIGR